MKENLPKIYRDNINLDTRSGFILNSRMSYVIFPSEKGIIYRSTRL